MEGAEARHEERTGSQGAGVKLHAYYGSPIVSCPGYSRYVLHLFKYTAPPAHPLFHTTGD